MIDFSPKRLSPGWAPCEVPIFTDLTAVIRECGNAGEQIMRQNDERTYEELCREAEQVQNASRLWEQGWEACDTQMQVIHNFGTKR